MVTISALRELVAAIEGAEELPHFEKTSFRLGGKIFATADAKGERACFKLTPIQQSVFSAHDKTIVYAVPNAWGKQGWTYADLKKVRKTVLKELLRTASENVSVKKSTPKKKTAVKRSK